MNKQGSLSRDSCWPLVFIPFRKKKKQKTNNSSPCEECIALDTQLPKNPTVAKSVSHNPLAALIQLLKEISCGKVTEKPASGTLQRGVPRLLLRESPCSTPRLINEPTTSHRARLPWGVRVTSDVSLPFNSGREKNRFF